MTMNPIGAVIASQTAISHARSALPRAPVIEQPAATLVRRIAARLGPNYHS
jgi:hypothetical protein